DHGLHLIREKYVKILDILGKIRQMNNDEAQRQSIVDQLKGLFASEEDLKVVLSTIENREPIAAEKSMQKYVISAVHYMANSTDLLGGTGEPKTLKLRKNRSDFVSDFTALNEKLEKKVSAEITRLEAEEGASEAETKSLEQKIKKEKSQYENILFLQKNLRSLNDLSQVQVDYLHKKMEESLEAENARIKGQLFSAPTKRKIVSALKIVVFVSLVVLLIVLTVVLGYKIENRMKSTNN
ncbi:hypothetical protein NEMIN01_2448, partial [Nematocida minor]|uniref:uncharacterized protein n=1 Tax=Nematocida minor TaxID=1912983 RepID=UPI0022202139